MKPEFNFRPSLTELLQQKKWWYTPAHADPIKVKEMTSTHRANLLRWLERHAAKLQDSACRQLEGLAGMINGEMALDDLEREVDRMESQDSLAWLNDQPLVKRLRMMHDDDERVARRDWVAAGVPAHRVAKCVNVWPYRTYWGYGNGMRAEVKFTNDSDVSELYIYTFHTVDTLGVDLVDDEGNIYGRQIKRIATV